MTLLLIDMKRTVNLCLFNLFHQEALHLNMKRTRKETLIKINLSENWPYLLKSCFDFRVMNTKVLTHFINMPPSARGIYCLYPYVICMGYVWLYDALDHRWVCIGYVPSKVQAVELIISCDFWRLCSVYGSFGLALGLLELGHMTADIKMDSEDHGFPVKKGWLHV